jgi:hypothetical protein
VLDFFPDLLDDSAAEPEPSHSPVIEVAR